MVAMGERCLSCSAGLALAPRVLSLHGAVAPRSVLLAKGAVTVIFTSVGL